MVFPDPEGPVTVTVSPAFTVSSTPSRMAREPIVTPMFSARISPIKVFQLRVAQIDPLVVTVHLD